MYYLETDPICADVYFSDSFLLLKKHPTAKKNGKTKEIVEYNQNAEGQKKTLEAIASGHVNLRNNPIVLHNIFKSFDWWEDFDSYYIYYCKPTSAKIHYGQYNYRDETYTYEFDVVRKFETRDELVSFIVKNYKYGALVASLLQKYTYYSPVSMEKLQASLRYVVATAGDEPQLVKRSGVYDVISELNASGRLVDEGLLWAINNSFVSVEKGLIYGSTLSKLINNGLSRSALEYVRRSSPKIPVGLDWDVRRLLSDKSDIAEVKELTGLLGLTDPTITLVVTQKEEECRDKEIERVEFKTVDEIKTYIIREYGVDYSAARQDVGEIYAKGERESWIAFETIVNNSEKA